jgi:hypothetical protein
MRAVVLAALIGVVHVHHAPSHDSDAPFERVLEGARAAGLDFVVLTEHYDGEQEAPLPGGEHAGLHEGQSGRPLLVLVGVEVGTEDGHLLALDVPRTPTAGLSAAETVERIHGWGGFAVVPHPFSHGGFHAWDLPFDGLEVHNHASDWRRFQGPLLPIWLVRFAFNRDAVLARMLTRPERELERWDTLLTEGRRVVGFSGADAHRNVSLFGWQLDPYAQQFRSVHTLCPDGTLTREAVWRFLRQGRCRIRYTLYDSRADDAEEVRFPSGRVELQLDGGRRLLEIRNPPLSSPP